MEIHKLDRDKAKNEAEKKIPDINNGGSRLPRATLPSPREMWKDIPKRRILVYGILLLALFATTVVYNLIQYEKATRPFVIGIPESMEELSFEFYDLCSDIEDYKEEYGTYPESIRDMLFSNHLVYRKFGDEAFRLIYNDGQSELVFDSVEDIGAIR